MERREAVANAAPAPACRRARLWPIAIAAALVVHAGIWLLLAVLAVRDPSFAVEPDHYRRSLDWDAIAARERASRALGWSVAIETGALSPGGRRIACRLRDRDGNPVAGAAVEVTAFHHARGGDRFRAALAEEAPGLYAARMDVERPGIWEFRIAARRGGTEFAHVALHRVEGGGR